MPFGEEPGLVVPLLVVLEPEPPLTEPLAPELMDEPDDIPERDPLRPVERVLVEAPEVIPGSLIVEPEVMPVPLLMPVPAVPEVIMPGVVDPEVEPGDDMPEVLPDEVWAPDMLPPEPMVPPAEPLGIEPPAEPPVDCA